MVFIPFSEAPRRRTPLCRSFLTGGVRRAVALRSASLRVPRTVLTFCVRVVLAVPALGFASGPCRGRFAPGRLRRRSGPLPCRARSALSDRPGLRAVGAARRTGPVPGFVPDPRRGRSGPRFGVAAEPRRSRSAGGACGGSRLAGGQPHRDGPRSAPPRWAYRFRWVSPRPTQPRAWLAWGTLAARAVPDPSSKRCRNAGASPHRNQGGPGTAHGGGAARHRNGLHPGRTLSQAQPHPGRRRRLPRRRRRQSFPRLRRHLAMGQPRWSP